MTQATPTSLQIDACGHDIFAIDTEYVRPGLDASHIIRADDQVAFVDTGVNSSVPNLLAALDKLEIKRESVQYVFLTHIHLDHAGGAGMLMQALPNAIAVVHPRGARHMASPGKLVIGATAVYGEAAFKAMYGDILPIASDRIYVPEDDEVILLGSTPLRILFTEGHAKHHYCLIHEQAKAIFTGDSFGISYRIFDTQNGPFVFPTTTPVHFDPKAAHEAVDCIVATGAQMALLTHYSAVGGLPALAHQLHADLDAFVDIAKTCADQALRTEMMRDSMKSYLLGRLDDHGVLLSSQELAVWLDMDVSLNVQGLEYWLKQNSYAA